MDLTSQMADIEGIVYSPWAQIITWAGWIFLGLILLALFILLIFKIKNKVQSPKKIPPDQQFFLDLKKLKKLKLIDSKEYRLFYLELSEIYRRYLTGRYDYPAIDKTSEEIISELFPKAEMDENLKKKSKDFFKRSDLIKFANRGSSPDEAKSDVDQLTKIVLKTKQIITEDKN